MPTTVGSLFDTESQAILEIINNQMEWELPDLDPWWSDTFSTSQGLVTDNLIGRDMLIKRVYKGSLAGTLRPGQWNSDVSLYGDQTDRFSPKSYNQRITEVWPDPLESPFAAPRTLNIHLRSMTTNLPLTKGMLQMEALDASIGDIVAPTLQGFVTNIAQTLCLYAYASQNSNYALCGIETASDVVNGTYSGNKTVTFTPDNRAVDRFIEGMSVDVYSSDFQTRRNEDNDDNRVWCYVSHVDETTPTVTLTLADGGGDEDDVSAGWSIADGDKVVLAGSVDGDGVSTGFAGLNSWIKSGGGSGGTEAANNYLLGNEATGTLDNGIIDVTRHPTHKSMTHDVNGPLTEHKMRLYVRAFNRAKKRHRQWIDTLISTDGVWSAYEKTKIGRERLDRTGRLSDLNSEGSTEGFTFTVDGMTVVGKTSNYCEAGAAYGHRFSGDNWRRVVPPNPQGVQSMQGMSPYAPFTFTAPLLTGTSSTRVPIYKTGSGVNQLTEGVQMPGELRMQLVAWEQTAGCKLLNIAEDRLYSDNLVLD